MERRNQAKKEAQVGTTAAREEDISAVEYNSCCSVTLLEADRAGLEAESLVGEAVVCWVEVDEG